MRIVCDTSERLVIRDLPWLGSIGWLCLLSALIGFAIGCTGEGRGSGILLFFGSISLAFDCSQRLEIDRRQRMLHWRTRRAFVVRRRTLPLSAVHSVRIDPPDFVGDHAGRNQGLLVLRLRSGEELKLRHFDLFPHENSRLAVVLSRALEEP